MKAEVQTYVLMPVLSLYLRRCAFGCQSKSGCSKLSFPSNPIKIETARAYPRKAGMKICAGHQLGACPQLLQYAEFIWQTSNSIKSWTVGDILEPFFPTRFLIPYLTSETALWGVCGQRFPSVRPLFCLSRSAGAASQPLLLSSSRSHPCVPWSLLHLSEAFPAAPVHYKVGLFALIFGGTRALGSAISEKSQVSEGFQNWLHHWIYWPWYPREWNFSGHFSQI